jgi:uncharacterized protein YydD (DUF2326 family)
VDNKMERGKIKTAEIKFLKAVERWTRIDQIKNEEIRKELNINALNYKIDLQSKNECTQWMEDEILWKEDMNYLCSKEISGTTKEMEKPEWAVA